MEIDIHLWESMNTAVRVVVVLLTLQAVGCIAVLVDRLILLRSSRKKSEVFAKEANPLLVRGDYDAVLDRAAKAKGSHLALFMHQGIQTFLDRRRAGFDDEKAAELARRALERKGEQVSEALNKGMNVLASTGSTAPFIGLLGTVLGILNAFDKMGESGGGGIQTIGPMISEALIVTGYGLAIAIPATLFYNWLSGRITHYETGLVNAGSELLDQLEAGVFEHELDEPESGEGMPNAAPTVA